MNKNFKKVLISTALIASVSFAQDATTNNETAQVSATETAVAAETEAAAETVSEAVTAITDSKKQYENTIGTIFARADYAPLKENPDTDQLLKMLDSTLNALMEEHLRAESFSPEECYEENCGYIDLIARNYK